MTTAPMEHVLALALILFAMGAFCALARRNLILILLGVEVMLNACTIALVGASLKWQALGGQAFALVLMALTAAEAAVGLALFVHVRKRAGTLDSSRFDTMRG
ncbi:NADH-quinone oxidoreductase subunit K [Fundidesulfovibrio magnetotacticus]|uniref:NADH-quinone oxidoreductase subunit K n=1 Tax=Fundidesulfovibrio magnetotacticus TaxID=2730080 RepID=A0A6V8LIA8_9BACT|nr:NADH-quinone oxidoreductase subunit NuoK [Fundidesulfovibrio magnetotacticus]GFK92453.1 NADH-quinone oxidoreductase subunit K [Fundidesulfovibrio magnetotacticus]